MTEKETAKLMAVFAGVYRDFYRDRDPGVMLETWHGVLRDIPYEVANAAALNYIRSEHFSPVPADIVTRAERIMGRQELTEGEAWALVANAVRRTDWMAPEKQFDKLPPAVQRAVGTPQTLVEWGKVDEAELATVIASNFQRAYRTMQTRQREMQALPAETRARLQALGAGRVGNGPTAGRNGPNSKIIPPDVNSYGENKNGTEGR